MKFNQHTIRKCHISLIKISQSLAREMTMMDKDISLEDLDPRAVGKNDQC